MKFGIYVHPRRPKVSVERIVEKLHQAGVSYDPKDPDIAVIVGGDGTFGYYGRTLKLPLLFVGVRESGVLGSKAKLAEVTFDRLGQAVRSIEGRYALTKRRMIRVCFNEKFTDVLTDVYLEQGIFSGCMRYIVSVTGQDMFREYAIGNGIIFSTAFGSQGYHSYPDRLTGRPQKRTDIAEDRIGVCHIIPVLLVREKDNIRRTNRNPRYTVPFQSKIQVSLSRNTDTRLYGTTSHSRGVAVKYGENVIITGSDRRASITKLQQ